MKPEDYAGTFCANGHLQGPGLCRVQPQFDHRQRATYWHRRCLACARNARKTYKNRRPRWKRPRSGRLIYTGRLLLLAAAGLRPAWRVRELADVAIRLWPGRFEGKYLPPRKHVTATLLSHRGPVSSGWIEVVERRTGQTGSTYRLTDAGRAVIDRLRDLLAGRPLTEAASLTDAVRRPQVRSRRLKVDSSRG